MKKLVKSLVCVCLLMSGLAVAAGQDNAGPPSPPKILTITREFLKPGKAGATHEKYESAFVKAFTAAKWKTTYLAVDSLSGKPRSLFFTGYDSFDAWEKDAKATEKAAAFSSALDRASVADGELLSELDSNVFAYREDYSLRAGVDIPHMRYFEISIYRTRPGHEKDWDAIVKMVTAAYDKIPNAHWATYQGVYGSSGNNYLVITPLKAASEIDEAFAQGKQFEAAMGEDGMKKLAELSAATIESSESNLFAFNPRNSYPSEKWIKADPDFWKPKKASAPASAAKKPAEPAAPKP